MASTALIIGGTGFLGTALCEELLRIGWEVTVLSRGNKPLTQEAVQSILADRSNREEFADAIRSRSFDLVVDCVCHNPADAEVSVQAFAGRCGHYVLISTDFVYTASSRSTYPLTEDSHTYSDTEYARGKLESEQLFLKAWRERQFPVTILRPSHIVGKGSRPGSDPVQARSERLIEFIRTGRGLQLLADGQLMIQPVWNREIGRGIAHMSGMPSSMGQLFHFAGPDCVTNHGYYQIIAELLNVPLQFESVSMEQFLQQKPAAKHNARHRIYDTSRLTQQTGYKPHLRLEDALKETVEWMIQDQGV
jgi:nucleoside-diphosphate-sugar epimerase